jgi:hypothetical protein
MNKEYNCRDIEVEIILAVIYNHFRNRFPDLYGGLNRDNPFVLKSLSIFEIYTNDKGEEVYFMKYF